MRRNMGEGIQNSNIPLFISQKRAIAMITKSNYREDGKAYS